MSHELKSIRDQMKSDFDATMQGLAVQRDATTSAITRLDSAIETLHSGLADLEEASNKTTDLVRDHIQNTTLRLDEMVDVWDRRTSSLESRVDAIEKRLAG